MTLGTENDSSRRAAADTREGNAEVGARRGCRGGCAGRLHLMAGTAGPTCARQPRSLGGWKMADTWSMGLPAPRSATVAASGSGSIATAWAAVAQSLVTVMTTARLSGGATGSDEQPGPWHACFGATGSDAGSGPCGS